MKDFIPSNEALELNKLEFDEPCFGFYTYKRELRRYTNFDGELNDFQTLKNSSITMGDGWCTAPTFSQAFRFFREKYNLHRHICYFEDTNVWHGDIYKIKTGGLMNNPMELTNYNSYEEAELECLRKLIEIVKQKQ
jgi:hypothetical protein